MHDGRLEKKNIVKKIKKKEVQEKVGIQFVNVRIKVIYLYSKTYILRLFIDVRW